MFTKETKTFIPIENEHIPNTLKGRCIKCKFYKKNECKMISRVKDRYEKDKYSLWLKNPSVSNRCKYYKKLREF
jgi:hypothetical protein